MTKETTQSIKSRLLNPNGYRGVASSNPEESAEAKMLEIIHREGDFGEVFEIVARVWLPGSGASEERFQADLARRGQHEYLEIHRQTVTYNGFLRERVPGGRMRGIVLAPDLEDRLLLAEETDEDFDSEDFLLDIEASATEAWEKDDIVTHIQE